MKGIEFVPYIPGGAPRPRPMSYVKLAEERSFSNQALAASARKICAGYPNLRSRVVIRLRPRRAARPSSPSARALVIRRRQLRHRLVVGADLARTRRRASSGRSPALLDVDTSVSLNRPEMTVSIDRQRASDLGVRAADVGNAVRLMIAGEDQISTYKEGDEQYDVTLQLLPEQQDGPGGDCRAS